MNNTPNGVIERLMEASMDKSAAAYARHFELEASLLQSAQRFLFSSNSKKTLHLNSDATFKSDLGELQNFLRSTELVDRLIASLKIIPLLRNSNPDASSRTPAFIEAQCVLTDLLLRYPVLLDPGFCLRTEKNSATYSVLERILISPGLRLPNIDQGTSWEQLVDFASHRSVFAHLRESISERSLPQLLRNMSSLGGNLSLYPNLFELTDAARDAIKQRKSPPKVTAELHLDTRSNCGDVASGLGQMLWATLVPGGPSTRFYQEADGFVESVVRRACNARQNHGAFVASQVLAGLSSSFDGQLSGVQAGKEQGAQLVSTLVKLRLVKSPVAAAQFAFDQVVLSSFNGSSPKLTAATDPAAAADFVSTAAAAAGMDAPWEDLCARIDKEDSKVRAHGLQPLAGPVEQALRSRAAEAQMFASIAQANANHAGASAAPEAVRRPRRVHV
ncbi:hypothetical protein [Hydrogenophaga sp. 2FB]|uniref:hypothetical protein n=1 Tax=Hydrogenophaga sp. 2FB TaxID=2502187 RepID=UPI0010F9F61D|nr:hypothetical protein [Hydrogenophaga sp. 2FB]